LFLLNFTNERDEHTCLIYIVMINSKFKSFTYTDAKVFHYNRVFICDKFNKFLHIRSKPEIRWNVLTSKVGICTPLRK